MNKRNLLFKSLFFAAATTLSATANSTGVPKFIEVGKFYTLPGFGGGQSVKVLEVDRENGWIKVQVEKPKSEVMWLNTNVLASLREGTPEPEKRPAASPPRF